MGRFAEKGYLYSLPRLAPSFGPGMCDGSERCRVEALPHGGVLKGYKLASH